MGLSQITYNGYTFPDRSNITIDEEFIYDEAGWTVTATQFTLRVSTIITNDEGYGPLALSPILTPDEQWQNASAFAAPTMQRARQLLSKPGQILEIKHDGFAPHWDINATTGGIQDIAWGPKPRVLRWSPVGHTHAVEIVWECEFRIPICDGRTSSPSFRGVASHNYAIAFSYDERGYTTRTINGRLEIAMTRRLGGNTVTDTVDKYRNFVVHTKPENFIRTVNWNISPDKRVATYVIVDREISSPNAWPTGVVNIQATHRASWSRNASLSRVTNTLSALIELAPYEHKSKAWAIFRGMVEKRHAFARSPIFMNALDVNEDIFANRVQFSLTYHFLSTLGAQALLSESGLFQPVSDALDNWASWDQSMKQLQPLRDGTATDLNYAHSRLAHADYAGEKLTDLCNQGPNGNIAYGRTPTPPVIPYGVLCNRKPSPGTSWLKYEASLSYDESTPAFASVSLSPNDLLHKTFSPSGGDVGLPVVLNTLEDAKRWVEERAGSQYFIVTGYAERVGYQVPKPGKLLIGGRLYTPVGRGLYAQKFLGDYFCQPLFGAAWKQMYRLDAPLTKLDPKDENGGVE